LPKLQAPGVTFGSATWAMFASALRRETEVRSREGDAAEMLGVLVDDFLADLGERGLDSAAKGADTNRLK